MAVAVVVAVCWVLFFVPAAEAKGHGDICQDFRSLNLTRGQTVTHWCPANKCSEGEVFGTAQYNETSDICMTALHAGVLISLNATVTVTRLQDLHGYVGGTIKNRIVSKSIKSSTNPSPVYQVESAVQEEGMVEEVLMVHNGASDDHLRFSCLSQDQVSPVFSSSTRKWSYKNITRMENAVESGEGSPRLVFKFPNEWNMHVIRFQGSRSDRDVLAVVQYPEAKYQSKVATVRVSVEDNVTIQLQKPKDQSDQNSPVYFRQWPDQWNSSPISNLTLHLSPAHPSQAGIYVVDNSKTGQNMYGAYFDVVVRECKAGYYGAGCSKECPRCQNGGQCHTRQGTCLCPPGFIGDTCQFACLPGLFGNKCQFKCDNKTVGFLGTKKKEVEREEGRCVGLTICLPPPYGCSCASGFTHPSPDTNSAPTCTRECPKGYFGADCSQQCSECDGDDCNRFSGTCLLGCKSGKTCRTGPSSPRATITPLRRGYKAALEASDSGVRYFISQQLSHHLSCPSDISKRHQQRQDFLITLPYSASDLSPHASYNVCLVASSRDGLSAPFCSTVETPSEVPDVKIIHRKCEENRQGLRCYTNLTGGCESYNGPNFHINFTLQTEEQQCSHHLTTLKDVGELRQNGTRAVVIFSEYLAGVKYQMRAEVWNDNGKGDEKSGSYTTKSKPPPRLQNVTHTVQSSTALQVLWDDPCPSNGKIEKVEFQVEPSRDIRHESCATTVPHNRCYSIHGLKLGNEYTFRIKESNSAGWSPWEVYKITFEEKKPGPPQAIKVIQGNNQVNLTLELPLEHGRTLRNCSIFLTRSRSKNCTITIEEEDSPMSCTIDGLEEGKAEEAKAHCCNTMFCGEDILESVATKPLSPQFTDSLSIVRKTNSTITLHLPSISSNGDGNNSLIVIVQLEAQNRSLNLTAKIQTLFEKHDCLTRRKRSISETEDQCQKQEWIAAELHQGGMEFVVGDGKEYNGFFNCPLQLGQAYSVGTMGVNKLLGEISYSQPVIERAVVVEPYDPHPSSTLLLLLLLLILPVLGLLVKLRLRKQSVSSALWVKFRRGVSQEDLAQPCETSKVPENHRLPNEVITNNHPDHKTKYEGWNEGIYENLASKESGAAVASHIPFSEVEDYLNKVIGSKEAENDFRTVPLILIKSTAVAQRPENKAKNCCMNNLPYDDTRVVLTCVGEDLTSDYINASHVKGYGNMRYIASQGPKDTRVSTIADFWRMTVEQNINVIIMVANFVKKGEEKVGEYFKPGQTLNFAGFEVTVLSTEHLPHFNISSLLVTRGEDSYQVQHYHYTSWPDHGIPAEAKSVAQMLSHFQSCHTEGGTVVHCSAGTGRTGTVLQVLLMCEMLKLKGSFSPTEVLARLRMSRSQLVENEAQYNLSLEILEETLFGQKTIVSTDDLLNHLDKYVAISRDEFARVKALPSPQSFTTSKLPIFQPLNCNQSVSPADSNRCYLQPGVDAWLSRYINAIPVPGLSKEGFMLVTGHPLSHTIANFWRLIAETGCALIIFVNSTENKDNSTFPNMMMEPGKVWKVDQYELHVEDTVPYGTWLRRSSLTITSNEDSTHHVDMYQSVGWPVSSQLPLSPYLLLTIAELLQIPRTHTSGPPLLCCRDGITGCGLVAGMALVMEQLKSEQVVDVYRTVVKLLRARQEFIVSEEQFFMLYTCAATYLKEYSSYGNFH